MNRTLTDISLVKIYPNNPKMWLNCDNFDYNGQIKCLQLLGVDIST